MVNKSVVRELVEILVVACAIALLTVSFIAQSYVVRGSSMEPTLHDSQRLLVNKMIYRIIRPRRGDVVVFRYPMDERRKFIKRVIGIEGDKISIDAGKVRVNGSPLIEPYVFDESSESYGPVVVPSRSLFVLGDNRLNSEDSRFPDVGFVSLGNVVGRAWLVYWPADQFTMLGDKKAKR